MSNPLVCVTAACICLIVCVICQVREAAESNVYSQLQCQMAAGQQKLERQAAQNSRPLSEANNELQVGYLHWACHSPCLTSGRACDGTLCLW